MGDLTKDERNLNLETEKQNPFKKLAPEVVAHILHFLPDIPSKISSSGVCRLWRQLVDFSSFAQLHLDFVRININGSPLQMCKWSKLLESLLPKISPITLRVSLSDGFDQWPPYDVITNQKTVLASVTSLIIEGSIRRERETNFVPKLIQSCSSLTDLGLLLTDGLDKLGAVHSAVRSKALSSLSVTLLSPARCEPEQLARMFAGFNPPTLKSLSLNASVSQVSNSHAELHDQDLYFDKWCTCNAKLRQLEHLEFTSRVLLSEGLSENFANLINYNMPKLKTARFSSSYCSTDNLTKLCSVFENLSKTPFSHPIDVFISTSPCKTIKIYSRITEAHPFKTKLTKTGFVYFPNSSGMKIVFTRSPPIGASRCKCFICRSEYNWVKEILANKLKDESSTRINFANFGIFTCQIGRLYADLLAIFPDLDKFELEDGVLKISRGSMTVPFKLDVHLHNVNLIGVLCSGCAMMSE